MNTLETIRKMNELTLLKSNAKYILINKSYSRNKTYSLLSMIMKYFL